MADGPLSITINGVAQTANVLYDSLTITDTLNQPKTCTFTTFNGYNPPAAATVVILRGTIPLFAGSIVTVQQLYVDSVTNVNWLVTAINYTFLLRRRRPFKSYAAVSATTVAQDLITSFSSTFTSVNVQAALPTVTIAFDGSQDLLGCLGALATLIGGYCYVDDARDLHVFLSEATNLPDNLDDSNTSAFNDPPLTAIVDESQLRTRDYVVGAGSTTLAAVGVGETILPLASVGPFDVSGGSAISGAQRLTYATTWPGGAPVNAPGLQMANGSGVDTGAHGYASTFVSAAGESLPGPSVAITVGPTPTPVAGPTPTLLPGVGPDPGVHKWAWTVVNSGGETLPSPVSATITTTSVAVPTPTTTPGFFNGWVAFAGRLSAGVYQWAVTWTDAAGGETLPGPVFTSTNPNPSSYFSMTLPNPPTNTTGRLYRTVAGGATLKLVATFGFRFGQEYQDVLPDASLGATAPGSNTCHDLHCTVSVSLGLGDAATTARKLYRTAAGGTQLKLVLTIGDNVTPSVNDTVADASLGANVPVATTAFANKVALPTIAIGPVGTTSRKVYRTAAGGSQLKLQQTIADNVTVAGVTDATADASLGANAPTSDTSGLSTTAASLTSGATAMGATALILLAATNFAPSGWVLMGSAPVRYTGISGTHLTGIPVTGPGSIMAAVPSGTPVTSVPLLSGIPGSGAGSIVAPLLVGAAVTLFVQRDDLAAQATLALVEDGGASDGVHEGYLTDTSLPSVAACQAAGDADLSLFSRPITTVTYATRDMKTVSGKPVLVNRTHPPIGPITLTIQSVTITNLGVAAPAGPIYTVSASSVKYALTDLLTRLLEGVAP